MEMMVSRIPCCRSSIRARICTDTPAEQGRQGGGGEGVGGGVRGRKGMMASPPSINSISDDLCKT